MKVILSRKGFDSTSGGYPSPILPNGVLQSLPIPDYYATTEYSKVKSRYKEMSLYDIMIKIKPWFVDPEGKWILDEKESCHLDPDIDKGALKRSRGWRGCFGQVGAAQTVLEKAGVDAGDLFLFFGWFRSCNNVSSDQLQMVKGDGEHVIFGYLQVDKKIYPCRDDIPEWLKDHPHAGGTAGNNCIYIARQKSTWDKNVPGYGVFDYSPELVLTKEGMPKSRWNLPDIFRGLDITYHKQSSWKDGYFQSAGRGQEFVVEENDAIMAWAQDLVSQHVVL